MAAITRRNFFGTAAAAAVPERNARPNLLLLITDQQSCCALSANGNRDLHTPAMDSLARAGSSFTESYSTYPVCSPARSTLFSSRMPHETGVRENNLPIAAGIPTMGEHFRAAGYHTVYGGKWHLPKTFGAPPGFDYLIGGHELGAMMDEPLATAVTKFLLEKPKQPFLLVVCFMNPHDICTWIRAHPGTRAHPARASYPQARANMAVSPDEPEYMQYHRMGGYDAMSTPERVATGYDAMASAVRIASEWNVTDFRHYLHDYYRMVEGVDRQIGRVLEALELSGCGDNTLTVFTSDHGEGLGSHRWVQKAVFWEEVVKVPFIVAGSMVSRRGVRNETDLVSGLDVVPTLCDYAGVKPPAGVRGLSLRRAVDGGALDRPFVVSELSNYGDRVRQCRMLRTKRYKYVAFNGGARPEQLFDLEFDPGETVNLARQSADVLQQHRRLLSSWIKETADDFRMPV